MQLRSRMRCAGCGWVAPADEPYPFRCPAAGGDDDVDHVLRRELELAAGSEALSGIAALFDDDEAQPFLKYRRLLHTWRAATEWGLGDPEWVRMTEELDRSVEKVAGVGFRETPLVDAPELAERLGIAKLWVKDETGNVSGSHKARHLMGLALWLEAVDRRIEGGELPETARLDGALAIASCGNAALAAAVIAGAAERALDVYVPQHADSTVLAELHRLSSRVHTCVRQQSELGDPCYLRFKEALARGAVPFSCQGSENGLVIEGAQTLVWEMVSALRRSGETVDRAFVQVGGGALATACIRGWSEAVQLGVLDQVPTIHAVQTASAYPLARAWDRLAGELAQLTGTFLETLMADPPTTAERAERARALVELLPAERIDEALASAARQRSRYMRPWEREPHSIATGILDDETYDWLAVIEGMLRTGGHPVTVSERTLAEANRLAREMTGIPVDPTGSAGLAGLIELSRAGGLAPNESVAVLFTGVER